MAKIRNISDDDRLVPDLGGRLVMAGQVVDVDDTDVHAFTRQVDVWAPVDQDAQEAHDAGEVELARVLGLTEPAEVGEDGHVLLAVGPDGPPSAKAPKSAWVDFLASRGHEAAELAQLTKGQLIELADQTDQGQEG